MTMTTATASADTSPAPSPISGFFWAVAWLLVTVIAVAFAQAIGPALFAFEPRGRGSGLALILPVPTAVVTILILLRAIRRRGPWSRYVASTSLAGRRADVDARLARDPYVTVLLVGVVVFVLWVALGILFAVLFTAARPVPGLLGALLVLSFVAIIWSGCLWLGLRRRAARRRQSGAK